jgi:hypothetical protein
MSLKIDVLDMITEYLEQHGYHGLYNPDGECACTPPGLAPCSNMSQHCVAGWMAPCDCGEHDWHITSEPRATPQPVAALSPQAPQAVCFWCAKHCPNARLTSESQDACWLSNTAEGRPAPAPAPVKDHCSRCLWWTTRHCPDARPAPGSQDACKLFKPKL